MELGYILVKGVIMWYPLQHVCSEHDCVIDVVSHPASAVSHLASNGVFIFV